MRSHSHHNQQKEQHEKTPKKEEKKPTPEKVSGNYFIQIGVFSDPEKLSQLNAIIHPAVKKQFGFWLDQYQSEPFVVYEAAILFESGSYKNCDSIITITAPLEDRITRVMQRDNSTREQVLHRINAQWTDEQRIAKSDFVIENSDAQQAKNSIDEILKILKIQQNEG